MPSDENMREHDAEIERLKAKFDEALSMGQFELAESYHAKIIEMEVPKR